MSETAQTSIVRLHQIAGSGGPTLVVHGGAGGRIKELSGEDAQSFADGLRQAYDAGWAVLTDGGSAVDAACAAVAALEDHPLFNAGRGAALTFDGTVEHDACVMAGDGAAGAVASSRVTKNPIKLAKVIMEESPHVLIVDPSAELAQEHGLEVVDNASFITDARRAQLDRILANQDAPLKHGTVGAVALDAEGFLACATSTGGISKQWAGRVGDTPIVGAGSYARDGVVAISCTGTGEAFLEGCVAHDVYARMVYSKQPIDQAVTECFDQEVAGRDATGGIICVDADGNALLAHNSQMMLAVFRENDDVVTWV